MFIFNLRLARQAKAALKYLNKERKKYGHPAMILDEKLCMQANAYANHLATSSYYQKAPRSQLHGAGNGIKLMLSFCCVIITIFKTLPYKIYLYDFDVKF